MGTPETGGQPALDYVVVDVFTKAAFKGNPLAVVFDTVGLSTEKMQAIAREFNLSETTFIQRRDKTVEVPEGVRVRIFTTHEELPFAGHPTLGTASVLKCEAPECVRNQTVTLALNVGPVPVRFSNGAPGELFGEMTQRDPEFGAELDRAEVAGFCGLTEDDLDPTLTPQVVSTGTAFAIVVLHSYEALARFRVRAQESMSWLRERGARWFYVVAPGQADEEDSPRYRARMQFYGGEDPATGSAAGCAIAYLVAHNAVASSDRIHVRQGVEMGRPSDLFLSARNDTGRVTDVLVSGSTVLVARGKLLTA
jgi:trans-2,3-dihydro-3-hydroxyanthranilate isomerase